MTEASILRADLTNEFNEIGISMTVTRSAPGAYDPSTGSVGAPTLTNYTGIGRLGSYSDIAIDGTMIKLNDRKATFIPDNIAFVPMVDDGLAAGGNTYSVVSVKPRELGGEYICHTLQVRR